MLAVHPGCFLPDTGRESLAGLSEDGQIIVNPVDRMKDASMGKKVYVGNLSYDTSDAGLAELFGAHGNVVSARTIVDRDTGRSKGFAFVEMGTDEEAQSAISALNGMSLDGRQIKVNESVEKPRTNSRW